MNFSLCVNMLVFAQTVTYDYNLQLGVVQKLLTVAIWSHYYQHCKIVQHICTSSAEHLALKLYGRIKGITSAILS